MMIALALCLIGCSTMSPERRSWEAGYLAYHKHSKKVFYSRGYHAASLEDRGLEVPEEYMEPK